MFAEMKKPFLEKFFYKSWESPVTLQLPSCLPYAYGSLQLKLFSVASFSEQMNLKNMILLLFVQTYQKTKEFPYMEMSRDNVQKRREAPYMEKSRDNVQKRYVYK